MIRSICFRPRLENLETRQLLDAKMTAIFDRGVLQVFGTEKKDKIEITEKDGKLKIDGVKIQVNGKKKSDISASLVQRIFVDAKGGNDKIMMVSKKGIAVSIPALIFAGPGDDVVRAGSGSDSVFGGPGNDEIDGGNGNDKLDGGQGDDTLTGNAGDDEMTGGQGVNILGGGDGVDTIREFGARLLLSDTSLESSPGFVSRQISIEKASLFGTAGDDYINARGFSGNVEISADSGNDVLVGGMAADRIVGGAGNDYLAGGPGADQLFAELGDDYLYGEDGDDEMFGGFGFDRLFGGGGVDLTLGEDGDDMLAEPRERWSGGGYSLLDVQKMHDYVPNQPAVKGDNDGKADQFDDVLQAGSPSCFFAASLSAFARTGNPASRIRYLENNQYGVTLFVPEAGYFPKNFARTEVVVSFDGTWDSLKDLQPTAEGDYWPTLYQRAFYKQFGEFPNGASTGFALMAITGNANWDFQGMARQLNGYYGKAPDQGSMDIRFISDALKNGNLITAGTPGTKKDPAKIVVFGETGIIAGHAYTVIGIEVMNGGNDALVTVRNPWGYDTRRDARYVDKINGNKEDGLVRITWAEFSTHFAEYVVGRA